MVLTGSLWLPGRKQIQKGFAPKSPGQVLLLNQGIYCHLLPPLYLSSLRAPKSGIGVGSASNSFSSSPLPSPSLFDIGFIIIAQVSLKLAT